MQFFKFWGDAIWESLTIGWIVFGGVSTAVPVTFYFLGKHWPSLLQIPWFKWCAEHQNELHVGTAVAFVVIYFFYAPFVSWSRERSARIEAEGRVAGEPRIKLDVMDAEGRKELEKTREELTKAQETIRALDPLQQHIASVTATAEVWVKTEGSDGATHSFGGGGATIAFARGMEALLATAALNASSKTQNKQKTIYLVFNSPIYGSLVGKPLIELATAEYVQLETGEPSESEVLGGTVIFTLNGSRRFEFPIPAQTTVKQRVFVRDLYQMKSQLK